MALTKDLLKSKFMVIISDWFFRNPEGGIGALSNQLACAVLAMQPVEAQEPPKDADLNAAVNCACRNPSCKNHNFAETGTAASSPTGDVIESEQMALTKEQIRGIAREAYRAAGGILITMWDIVCLDAASGAVARLQEIRETLLKGVRK
jgi:hypothetical protein